VQPVRAHQRVGGAANHDTVGSESLQLIVVDDRTAGVFCDDPHRGAPVDAIAANHGACTHHVYVRLVRIDEIVALDEEGRPSFQLLQSAMLPGASPPPIFYYVFDLIQLDGKDLTGLPLFQRKAMTQALIAAASDPIRFSAGIRAESDRLLKELKRRGLEGLIAKRKDSKYEIGRRSGAWVKFKWTNEQEFVIGGYTEPRGTRSHFGAVLVGYFERGKLRFASKVGTGFDQKLLGTLHGKFQKLRPGASQITRDLAFFAAYGIDHDGLSQVEPGFQGFFQLRVDPARDRDADAHNAGLMRLAQQP